MALTKYSDVKHVAKKFKINHQAALRCILKAETCPQCKKKGLLEYFCSDGSSSECMFCDYVIE